MKKDKEWLKNQIEIMGSETSENYPHEQMVDREEVLNLIDLLEEPEKVVIPRFVAEAFEKARGCNFYAEQLISAMYESSDEVGYWLEVPSNEKLLLRAWLDGYEIEKEKLYWVIDKSKRPILTIHEGKVIASASVSKVERAEKLSTPDYKYRLTEKQIKDYDPRFMAFAEEVAE